MAGCLQLAFCPWHLPSSASEESGPLGIAHFFCTKNPNSSTVDLVGQLAGFPRASAVYLFHACTMGQIHQLGPQLHLFQNKVSIFHSSLSEALMTDEHLKVIELPFRHVALPLEIYRLALDLPAGRRQLRTLLFMRPEAAAKAKRDATPLRLISWLSYKLNPAPFHLGRDRRWQSLTDG